ncbi:ethyl tert-butyl ether degradation protein EthD [Bordetella genomosp. 9]|uniref:Ethyl tert-butyl ether degradation protein EthD n=1 Tax=Bordetella genomosp. 9 TaxID=1416803 RepID=A0A261R4Z1_9BORD|nr:EthD family reductase [Bordetella genomosp. 9]OZI19837.1 ethyl tert-butyl ether degradation protein EthD [Bordetella genomosp. 9]
MTDNSKTVVVYVTYQGTPETRFDRDYYVNGHLPLVMKCWGRYGLRDVAAFFPAQDRRGTIAICECIFADEAAVEAAFSSAEVPEVMADVSRFTDATPARSRAAQL